MLIILRLRMAPVNATQFWGQNPQKYLNNINQECSTKVTNLESNQDPEVGLDIVVKVEVERT